MGWDGGHLHEFVFADERYSVRNPGWDMLEDVQDESSVTLQQALGGRKTFMYVYDFGDDWRHKVKVEKIILLDVPLPLAHLPGRRKRLSTRRCGRLARV